MSYRIWLPEIGIALGVLLSVLLAIILAEILSHRQIPSACRIQHPTTQQQTDVKRYVKPGLRVAPGPPTDPATSKLDQGSAEDSNPSTDTSRFWEDGLAQWIIAGTGFLALLISAWAVWLVRSTLHVMEATLVEAQEATKAAQTAVVITDKTAQHQLRAYMAVQSTELTLNDLKAEARIGIKNCGQTPAMQTRFWSLMKLCLPNECEFRDGVFSWGISAGPASLHFLSSELNLSSQQVNALKDGQMFVHLWGAVEYCDIFGNLRHTHFRCVSTRELNGTYRFTPCKVGNDSD